MIGYPYDYGDNLTPEERFLNFKTFVVSYGLLILVLALKASPAFSADPPKDSPPSGLGFKLEDKTLVIPDESKKPAIIPPSKFMNSKINGGLTLFSILYIALQTAYNSNGLLVGATFLLIAYAIGGHIK